MSWKKFGCLILTIALIMVTFGSTLDVAMADEAQPGGSEDIWSLISELEEDALSGRKGAPAQGDYVVTEPTEEFFADMVDDVEKTVQEWSGYVEGSLVRNGDVLFWDGTDGIGYGYVPSLRAKQYKAEQAQTSGLLLDEAETGNVEINFAGSGQERDRYRDVALFQPQWGVDPDLTDKQDRYYYEGLKIACNIKGHFYMYRHTRATLSNLAYEIENSKVVLIDTHGNTDYSKWENGVRDQTSRANTSYITLVYDGADITQQDMATVHGTYGDYKHAYHHGGVGSDSVWCVDGTAIANHMSQKTNNSFVWLASCLGMATDGLFAPLRDKGVEVAFGYTQEVTIRLDYLYMVGFWDKMSQEDPYTVKDAAAYIKERYGAYDKYGPTPKAYPIFVSSQDPYPGQGNVDAVQPVYSEWKLPVSIDPVDIVKLEGVDTDWECHFTWTIDQKVSTGDFKNIKVKAQLLILNADGNIYDHCDPPVTIIRPENSPAHSYQAIVKAEDSPNGYEYRSPIRFFDDNHHLWVFDGFDWPEGDGVPWDMYANYHCDHCGKTFSWYLWEVVPSGFWRICGHDAPLVTAYIDLRDALDNKLNHEERVRGHSAEEWKFQGFEWHTTGEISADAIYYYDLSQEANVDYDMLDYLPDSDKWEITESEGNKYIKYKVRVKPEKVTSGRPGMAAYSLPKYKASITAEEAPDGRPNSQTKTIIPGLDPDVKPGPIDYGDIIGPPEERKTDLDFLVFGDTIIKPIKTFIS